MYVCVGIALCGHTQDALIIGSAEESHSGAYTCQLSNMAGVYTWAELSLTVKGS